MVREGRVRRREGQRPYQNRDAVGIRRNSLARDLRASLEACWCVPVHSGSFRFCESQRQSRLGPENHCPPCSPLRGKDRSAAGGRPPWLRGHP